MTSFVVPEIPTNREVALELCRLGVAVFPCDPNVAPNPRGKSPLHNIKWKDVPIGDVDWVERQWRRSPAAVVGMHLRDQRIFVVDTDGEEGQRQWRERIAAHGGDGGGPRTITPNGVHIFYLLPEGVELGNGLGGFTPKRQGGKIDVRGPGLGYVIAPGSEMEDGATYMASGGSFLDAPLMPDWLIDVLQAKPPQVDAPTSPAPAPRNFRATASKENARIKAWAQAAFEAEISNVANCGEGGRNEALNIAAFSLYQMVAGGFLDSGAVHHALIEAAQRNGSYAEDRREVEGTIRSGMQAGMAKPREVPADILDDNKFEAIGRKAVAGRLVVGDDGVGDPHPTQWGVSDVSIVASEASPAPELPLRQTLCATAANWVEDAAKAKSSAPDYVLAGLISVCSALLGNTRRSAPNENWLEPPVLNFAVVGNPSSGKSPALDAITTPLKKIEMDENEDWEQRNRDHDAATRIAARHLAVWEEEVKSAVRGGYPPPDRPAEADEPKPIARRRIMSTDPTTEVAARLSASNPRGLILCRDELAGWLANMDRYSGGGGGDRAFWLESYGGRSWTPDRVKDGNNGVSVPRLTWAILGCIQPDRLNSKLLQGDDDGLAARFLYIWPAAPKLIRAPDGLNIGRVLHWLKRLREIEWDEAFSVSVPFSKDARETLFQWSVETQSLEMDASGLLRAWVGKMKGFAVRLALVLAFIDWACDGKGGPPNEITNDHLLRSTAFLRDYALPMANRCFGEASLPEAERDARTLARWIKRQPSVPVTLNARTLSKMRGRPLSSSVERIKAALGILAEHHWVRSAPGRSGGSGGAPRGDWAVNPDLTAALAAEGSFQ
jgi:hypothetical protein